MLSLLASIALAPGTLNPPTQGMMAPFAEQPSELVTLQPDGTTLYVWPPVNTMYLLVAPLDEIDRWMKRESMRVADAEWIGLHDIEQCAQENLLCLHMNGVRSPAALTRMLTPEQWSLFFDRIIQDARMKNDATRVHRYLARFLRIPEKNQIESGTPDLTPLILAVIDATASGDTTGASDFSRLDDGWMSFDAEVVRAAFMNAVENAESQDVSRYLAMLAWMYDKDLSAQLRRIKQPEKPSS